MRTFHRLPRQSAHQKQSNLIVYRKTFCSITMLRISHSCRFGKGLLSVPLCHIKVKVQLSSNKLSYLLDLHTQKPHPSLQIYHFSASSYLGIYSFIFILTKRGLKAVARLDKNKVQANGHHKSVYLISNLNFHYNNVGVLRCRREIM